MLVAIGALVVLVVAAAANVPTQLAFGWTQSPTRQHVIEQQTDETVCNPSTDGYPESCAVVNPTAEQGYGDGWGCAWDIDDNSHATGFGQLEPGASVTFSQCEIHQGFNGPPDVAHCETACGTPYGVQVYAPTAQLDVNACFTPPSRCFQLAPVPEGRQWAYRLCIRELYPYGQWEFPIEGSNGGIGILTQQTVTVHNPTAKTVRKIAGRVDQIGFFQSTSYCAYYASDANRDDPFRWSP